MGNKTKKQERELIVCKSASSIPITKQIDLSRLPLSYIELVFLNPDIGKVFPRHQKMRPTNYWGPNYANSEQSSRAIRAFLTKAEENLGQIDTTVEMKGWFDSFAHRVYNAGIKRNEECDGLVVPTLWYGRMDINLGLKNIPDSNKRDRTDKCPLWISLDMGEYIRLGRPLDIWVRTEQKISGDYI